MIAAVVAARREVPIVAIADRLAAGQFMQTDGLLDAAFAAFDAALHGGAVTDATLRAAASAGIARAIAAALVDGAESGDLPGVTFDRANPQAVRWARDRSAALVSQVTEETRAAVRAVIARSIRGELTPRQAARLIRDVVGLTQRQAEAVLARRDALSAAGSGASAIDAASTRYAAQLVRQRAATIARTETIAAANEGARQLWVQARDRGLIGADAVRVWSISPARAGRAVRVVCPICQGLAGTTASIDGTFAGGIVGPPAHPNCRCATTLRIGGAR